MKLGLFVVGPSDKASLLILLRRVCETRSIRIEVVPRVIPQGDMFSGEKVAAYIRAMASQHPDVGKVLLCVDSECTDPNEVRQKTEETLQHIRRLNLQAVVQYIVVVHALEGWLMADEEAVGKVLGASTMKPIRNEPETECKPADVLEDLFAQHGKDFRKTVHDPQIAERANPELIARRSGSFYSFVEAVIKL